jgi:hypothetical protein
MRIWKDKAEKNLLLLVVGISILLVLVQIRLPLACFLNNTVVGNVLTANATQATISDLLTGLVSAYIFYIFIDYIPRHRKEQKLKNALNTIVASVLNAYQQARIFGHECEITHYSNEVLTPAWLTHNKNQLKENKARYVQMKCALETAHSRIEDFRHSLPMAVNLSPEHAIKWLVITDKLRLLFELYPEVPTNMPNEKIHLIDLNTEENPIFNFKSSLSFRLFEFFEKAEAWLTESKS